MSKPFTYDKERICYIFEHYTGKKDILYDRLLNDAKIPQVISFIRDKSKCDENYILELLDGLPENDVNLKYNNYSIINYAIDVDHRKVVKYLFDNFENITIDYKDIHILVYNNNVGMLNTLINISINKNNKIDFNCKNTIGNTPLYSAILHNNYMIGKELLRYPDIELNDITHLDNSSTNFNDKSTVALQLAKDLKKQEMITLLEEYETLMNK